MGGRGFLPSGPASLLLSGVCLATPGNTMVAQVDCCSDPALLFSHSSELANVRALLHFWLEVITKTT